jgi:heme exporter protein C
MILAVGKIFKLKNVAVIMFLSVLSAVLLALAVYFVLVSPHDYQQLLTVKIMYIHVPCSWLAMLCYGLIFICSTIAFIGKNPLFGIIARSAAKVGLIFCMLSLITGAIWGKPIWGVYWVWDARITSMFFLFLLYVGYLWVASMQEFNVNLDKLLGVFAIFGAINLPIIKFSTQYWNTLHQPSSFLRKGGVAIELSFLKPLLMMFAALSALCCLLLFLDVLFILMQKKLSNRNL